VRAIVSQGSNHGDREATLARSKELLDAHPAVRVVAASTLRETEPWGLVDQPRFLNGVVAVDTTLAPRPLLDVLLGIEETLGRVRGERWGPRTVDLDLLLYGALVVDEPGLVVPHPRLHERRFVLEPLAELAPEEVVPGRGAVRELLDAVAADEAG
jgi:2-amino-4-hydroxy-6-hydroxymethyldihydropteridine diphosphokinase